MTRPVTSRAVIVSHGQPGDPGPQQQAIEDLAARVSACDPGCAVAGATLAMPGALAAVAGDDSLIYPMFMAEGWFTRSELPRRLAQAGAGGARVLRPFGTDPALPGLIVAQAHAAAAAQGWAPGDTTLLLSAHGSQRSQASFTITTALAETVAPGQRLHVFPREGHWLLFDPETGARDLSVPNTLMQRFGNNECGIYAEIISDGGAAIGDTIAAEPQ